MKKTSKPNALKVFNDNKANAIKKASASMSAFKKSLPKAQMGVSTPFQDYMKTPKAVPSDTVMGINPVRQVVSGYSPTLPKAKNSSNQKALENAWEKTYGQDYKQMDNRSIEKKSLADKNMTMDEYQRYKSGWKKGQK
jgi:hypothetical protein